jgi:hypothetical protein
VKQMDLIKAAYILHSGEVQEEVLRITKPDDELLLSLVHDFQRVQAQSDHKTELVCFFEQIPCDIMAIVGMSEKKVCAVSSRRDGKN